MEVLLIVMACFAGMFAFAFGLAGFLGLLDFEWPPEPRPRVLVLCEPLFTGGFLNALHDIVVNWPKRRTQRRLVYVGFANGLVFVGLIALLTRLT